MMVFSSLVSARRKFIAGLSVPLRMHIRKMFHLCQPQPQQNVLDIGRVCGADLKQRLGVLRGKELRQLWSGACG